MNTSTPLRTRFAPSPTGFLHIGSLRTALYAYLFAKKNNGAFILRIEDTDQTRQVAGATESLINILHSFDLNYDEGPDVGGPHQPYIQSQRVKIHQKHAQLLLENNHAYRCFCTKERLEAMRLSQQNRKQAPMYDQTCRHLSESEIKEKLDSAMPFVIRQKIPANRRIIFQDLVRGQIEIDSNTIDDQVLLKSAGFPTYHLANVVDDHLMEINYVIRAEEWLPSTPKHILLYEAFDWAPPHFAHLPLLLNPDKSKLSKRQGDVAVEDYLKKGYLKETIINFVALLGWNPGSGEQKEIFSLAELIARFSLEKVQKAGAIFNIEKLNWMNGHYIRSLSVSELTTKILPFLEKEPWFPESPYHADTAYLESCVAMEQQRLKKLSEAPPLLKFLLIDELQYPIDLFINEKMKVDLEMAKTALSKSLPALEKLENYDSETAIKEQLTTVINELGVTNGQILWPLRSALSGAPHSPGVFEIIHVLGKKRSLERIQAGLKLLNTN